MDISDIFQNPALLKDGSLLGEQNRFTNVGDMIDCYRNLNRAHTFSIRQRQGQFKGLVSGYARSIVISNPAFVVGLKARVRVVAEGVRNVHSFVRGTFVSAFDADVPQDVQQRLTRATYAPYVSDCFFELERDANGNAIAGTTKAISPEANYSFAILNGRDVFLIP